MELSGHAKIALAIVVIAALGGGVLASQGIFTQVNGEAEHDGLSASINFRPAGGANTMSFLPSADYFEPPAFSFIDDGNPFSVTTEDGTDVSDSEMVIQVKARLLTAGVPVTNWAITGSAVVKVNGETFKTYTLGKSGTGTPPNPVTLSMSGADEAVITVAELESKWGQYNYGEHTVSISGSAKATVNFEDGKQKIIDLTSQGLGSVKFHSDSDATATLELESNYGSAGTTTETTTGSGSSSGSTTSPPPAEVTYITDVWNSGTSSTIFPIDNNLSDRRHQMVITALDRRNLEIVSTTFMLEQTTYNPGGTIAAELRTGQTTVAKSNTIAASSLTRNALTQVTFTFPQGTKTPNSEFSIAVVYTPGSGDNARILLYTDVKDTYTGGYLQAFSSSYAGGVYQNNGADWNGSVKYKA